MKTPKLDILDTAGGDGKVAKACKLKLDAVRKWRSFGRVPPKHYATVAKLARVPVDEVIAARLVKVRQKPKAA